MRGPFLAELSGGDVAPGLPRPLRKTEEIGRTLSVCPRCLRTVEAAVVNDNGTVMIEKICPRHGVFKTVHIWDSERVYRGLSEIFEGQQARAANGLVLNVTNNCNLHCSFCFARANERTANSLSRDAIERILARHRGGIVYFSGGEPTVHRGLLADMRLVKERGRSIGLFSNGKKLQQLSYVNQLRDAGVDFVILQFDSLCDEHYIFMRGEALVQQKMRALDNLRSVRIPVYLFVMLLEGRNITEIASLIRFVSAKSDFIKIINFNPVWDIGRVGAHQKIATSKILSAIESQTGLTTGDFLDSTAFSFYLFEALGKLSKKSLNLQPACELRCYVMFRRGRPVPLTKIVDIKRLNFYLMKIVKGSGAERTSRLLLLPVFFLEAFIANGNFRFLLRLILKNLVRNLLGISLLRLSPFVSIIVGTFQTAENLDFNSVKTCNLYADYPQGEFVFSACIRQILMDGIDGAEGADMQDLLSSYRKYVFGP